MCSPTHHELPGHRQNATQQYNQDIYYFKNTMHCGIDTTGTSAIHFRIRAVGRGSVLPHETLVGEAVPLGPFILHRESSKSKR